MNQKQLTQAIREGLNQHSNDFWRDFTKGLYWSLGLFVLIIILFVAWNNFYEARYPPTAMASERENCNYPYITCKIYEEHRYYNCQGKVYPASVYVDTTPEAQRNLTVTSINITKSNEPCSDVSNQIPLTTKTICGYSESNSFYQQFKDNYDGLFKLKMECN